jgi:hypothetical protein
MPLNQRTIDIVDAPQMRFSAAIALFQRNADAVGSARDTCRGDSSSREIRCCSGA